MEEAILKIFDKYPGGKRDTLIPILQDIQDSLGYIPETAVVKVGEFLDLPTSKIYGLATFYNQFRFRKKAKYHIRICHGTTCHIHGSESLLNELTKILGIGEGEISSDGLFSLEILSCIGACARSPVLVINGEYFPAMDLPNLKQRLEKLKAREES